MRFKAMSVSISIPESLAHTLNYSNYLMVSQHCWARQTVSVQCFIHLCCQLSFRFQNNQKVLSQINRKWRPHIHRRHLPEVSWVNNEWSVSLSHILSRQTIQMGLPPCPVAMLANTTSNRNSTWSQAVPVATQCQWKCQYQEKEMFVEHR